MSNKIKEEKIVSLDREAIVMKLANKFSSLRISNHPLASARKFENKCFAESSNLSEYKVSVKKHLNRLSHTLQKVKALEKVKAEAKALEKMKASSFLSQKERESIVLKIANKLAVYISNPIANAQKIENRCFAESSNLSEYKSVMQSKFQKVSLALQEMKSKRLCLNVDECGKFSNELCARIVNTVVNAEASC